MKLTVRRTSKMSNTEELLIAIYGEPSDGDIVALGSREAVLDALTYNPEFKKLKAFIADEVKKARLDENNRLFRKVGLYPDDIASFNNELLGKWFERKLTHSKIEARIDELKGEQVT